MFNYKEEVASCLPDITRIVSKKLYKFTVEDKEDVVYSIILRLYENESNFDLNRQHKLKAYVITSTYNYIYDFLKKNRKRVEITSIDPYLLDNLYSDNIDPERLYTNKELIDKSSLSKVELDILDIISASNYIINTEDISLCLGLSISRVYQLIHGIRSKLSA